MLIAPFQDKAFPATGSLEGAVTAWERELGLRLPEDYRNFLLRFDGGYPYPNFFDSALIRAGVVVSSETLMVVEFFYSLAEGQAHWNKASYGAGTPPGMAFIGSEPGGTEVLMSLRPQDFGVIYLWYHSTNIWGTDGNDDSALYRQADSFNDFLVSLFDTADREGYEGWYRPEAAKAALTCQLPL